MAENGDDPDEELLAVLSSLSAEEDGDAGEGPVLSAMQTLATQLKDPVTTPPGLDVEALLALAAAGPPLLDVRSPGEFAKGHVPGARSMPLFSDTERAEVGTTYSQCSREKAMVLGMSLVRPKLQALVAEVQALLEGRAGAGNAAGAADADGPEVPDVLVYCWRGGMRSGSVAWLLRRRGFRVRVLRGGYKAYRTWALSRWGDLQLPRGAGVPSEVVEAARALPGPRVCVIGGRTGTGKTRVLHALRDELGQAIVDLEGLANHRGSTFGWCGQSGRPQPTSEHFSNLVAHAWRAAGLKAEASGGWVFIEDEDKHIGTCEVPHGMYAMLRCAPLVVRVNVGEAARVRLLLEMYASPEAWGEDAEAWAADMEASINRLSKRLGGGLVKDLVDKLRARDFAAVAQSLLGYYDRLYDKHVANGGGTGSGVGERPGALLDVMNDAAAESLDALGLGREVLARVREFEETESQRKRAN